MTLPVEVTLAAAPARPRGRHPRGRARCWCRPATARRATWTACCSESARPPPSSARAWPSRTAMVEDKGLVRRTGLAVLQVPGGVAWTDAGRPAADGAAGGGDRRGERPAHRGAAPPDPPDGRRGADAAARHHGRCRGHRRRADRRGRADGRAGPRRPAGRPGPDARLPAGPARPPGRAVGAGAEALCSAGCTCATARPWPTPAASPRC